MYGEDRFYPLVSGIRVQLGAVFCGADTITARDHISWPPHMRYDNGYEHKLYIGADASGFFRLDDLDVQLESLALVEKKFEWTFMRERIGSKAIPAACFRKREWNGEPSSHIWGFGRPHPFDLLFKPHQLLAGAVKDHRPTAATTPPDWKFEPVWMCAIIQGIPYFYEFDPDWSRKDSSVQMIVGIHPPEFCEPEFIPEPLIRFAEKNSSWRSIARTLRSDIPMDSIVDLEDLQDI